MRNFETDVQLLKYRILMAVAKRAFDGNLMESYYEIPKEISPGPRATMRCCIYKERAVAQERVRLAMGGDRRNKNVVEVIDIGCDECPVDRYTISASCRGCISSRCIKNCPKNAITKDKNGKAHIDQDLCIECGRCAKVCPYSAIMENVRPCEKSCKIGAISMDADKKASIDEEKCIACGACVYQCPFGAVMDKSFMTDAINIIKNSDNGNNYKVVAIVAPAISAQFHDASLGQVVSAIKKLGIHDVVEAAIGADMVAKKEAEELAEKGLLTSSCCPAFVKYIETAFPDMKQHISHNLSPMAEIGRYVKINADMPVRTIFIGPCIAKKAEQQKPTVDLWIDCVITFEELQAMVDSQGCPPEEMEESVLDDASYFGRIFARSGGLSEAVAQSVKEQNLNIEPTVSICDGIEQCKIALLKASKGKLDANFIEGMACVGGCIGGAASISHSARDKMKVDTYGKNTTKEGILKAIDEFNVKV